MRWQIPLQHDTGLTDDLVQDPLPISSHGAQQEAAPDCPAGQSGAACRGPDPGSLFDELAGLRNLGDQRSYFGGNLWEGFMNDSLRRPHQVYL